MATLALPSLPPPGSPPGALAELGVLTSCLWPRAWGGGRCSQPPLHALLILLGRHPKESRRRPRDGGEKSQMFTQLHGVFMAKRTFSSFEYWGISFLLNTSILDPISETGLKALRGEKKSAGNSKRTSFVVAGFCSLSFPVTSPVVGGRPEGVTPQYCAEYCLASPHHPPASKQPPGGCRPITGGTASTPAAEELWAASEGPGREQHLHAGSDGVVRASAQG